MEAVRGWVWIFSGIAQWDPDDEKVLVQLWAIRLRLLKNATAITLLRRMF